MLIVLSPAKKLNEQQVIVKQSSLPIFIDEASILIEKLKEYSKNDLKKLMNLSDNLSYLNKERYQLWNKNHENTPLKSIAFRLKPAGLMFNGEAYKGLAAKGLTINEMKYAQQHLRILSGLYGILKPLDLIYPHRLEMGTKLKVNATKNLYEFWGDKIVDALNDELKQHHEKVVINLASNEYFKSINTKKLNAKVISASFKEYKQGTYKTIVVYAKKARGMMANFIIKNKIEKVENLIAFDMDGYCYNEAASTPDELVFLRG